MFIILLVVPAVKKRMSSIDLPACLPLAPPQRRAWIEHAGERHSSFFSSWQALLTQMLAA
jgi:hypothetical protein